MKRITAADSKKLQDAGWTYVDVRTEGEFVAGHPVGAVNIPVNAPDFVALMQVKFAPDAKLIIGCQAGGRSMRAAAVLEPKGYTQLAVNVGGFEEWSQQQLPTVKGSTS